MSILITASKITPLLELLYLLLVIKTKGKSDDNLRVEVSRVAKEVLPVWGKAIPNLRSTCLSMLANKGDDALIELGGTLKQLAIQGKADVDVPMVDIETLATLATFFRTGNETALTKLRRTASISKSSFVVQQLAPKVGNQHDAKTALTKLVRKLVGRSDSALTIEEAARVRETDSEQYKEYLALRREFNQAWKDALVSYIRKSGEEKVSYQKALSYLHLQGVEHLLPTGFDGYIDDMSRLYTNSGELIDGIPNAITFPSVVMNKSYGKADGGDWVFMSKRSDGSPGPYSYTSAFKKKQALSKFSKVDALSNKMDSIRKKWCSKLRKFNIEEPTSVASVILEILYLFSARIGSVGNKADGKATFGVSTLLCKHAIIDPAGNIILRYKGKDGVATTHKIMKTDPDARFLIKPLNQLLANKEAKDRIFTYERNSRKLIVSSADVNNFFKACGAPSDTTVHKIRTYHGTKLFRELLSDYIDSGKKPKTERDAMVIFKKMSEVVGKKLNHVRRGQSGTNVTGTTALNAYIDPSVQILYWTRVGFRIPKTLEKYSNMISE